MSRRHAIAVAVAIAAMVAALLPPLWIQTTGDDVVLEVAPVDPLSLFRGNYVDLTYDLDFEVDDTGRDRSWEWNEARLCRLRRCPTSQRGPSRRSREPGTRTGRDLHSRPVPRIGRRCFSITRTVLRHRRAGWAPRNPAVESGRHRQDDRWLSSDPPRPRTGVSPTL